MQFHLSQTGRSGAHLLLDAIAREGVTRIHLPPGPLPIGVLIINRRVVIIGTSQTRLIGDVNLGDRARLRLEGLNVEGRLNVAGAAVFHAVDCDVDGGLALGGDSSTILQRCALHNSADRVALVASERAKASVEDTTLSGGNVVAVLGPTTQVGFARSHLAGLAVHDRHDPAPDAHQQREGPRLPKLSRLHFFKGN